MIVSSFPTTVLSASLYPSTPHKAPTPPASSSSDRPVINNSHINPKADNPVRPISKQ